MKIDIEINSTRLTAEKKQEIKSNIEHEILHHKNCLKKPTTKLTVSLFEEPVLGNLSGAAVNEQGEEAIKITYKLFGGETDYQYC